MTQFIPAYIFTAIIFLILDFIWLGFVARDFYFTALKELMKEKPDMLIAAVFYLVYAVGIVIFAVNPALNEGEWKTALIYGALFGFFCYATYDFTNMATLRGWPVKVSVVDIIWGVFITSASATSSYFLTLVTMSKMGITGN